jgi:hypothetical protein
LAVGIVVDSGMMMVLMMMMMDMEELCRMSRVKGGGMGTASEGAFVF